MKKNKYKNIAKEVIQNEIEGLKKKYGPDGSDYYQLGIIY